MGLSGISKIIEAEVGVISYRAKTEFNNYFIIHMDYYQNNDLITTKQSTKVSQDKMFLKQEYF